jgi:hypothetical protein
MPRRPLLSVLIASVLVAPLAAHPQTLGVGRVEGAAALNVRSGPGVEHTSTAQLRRGDAVVVDAVEGKWAHVRHAGGEGWVFASFVVVPTVAAAPTATSGPRSPGPVVGAGEPPAGGVEGAEGTPIAEPAQPEVVEAQLPDDVRSDIDRILTLSEAMHHDLERRRNSPPTPSQTGSGMSFGLFALGGVIGFLAGTIVGRQQERRGRSRVRF